MCASVSQAPTSLGTPEPRTQQGRSPGREHRPWQRSAAFPTNGVDSQSSLEGKPGTMSTCLTALTLVICYLDLGKGLGKNCPHHFVSQDTAVLEKTELLTVYLDRFLPRPVCFRSDSGFSL